ncbi:MAG: asparagine synthase (glutamine-hydrolyzing) [Bryobacteraceae bacterium]
MCGIAGFALRSQEAPIDVLRAMCDQMVHRGPDDEGYHVDGGCGIGMRRLSIIDLNTGHQPIANEDGSAWVVCNGEIYNYRELRQELIDRGHRFSTQSDTEILVHLYEDAGTDGISRLRGMFAFAIWDVRRKQLLLARDRFGKKPLYYALLPSGLYFASELKSLRKAAIPLDLDEEALRLYFQFNYVPDPYTPFRAIRKLRPGAWLTYRLDGESSEQRYWKLPPSAEQAAPGMTEEETCRRLRDVFDESVRMRMVADVPLGAFLSGGIDSSLVVASMAMQSSEPVKTFSIGFEEAQYNELEYASLVARRYGTEHHQIVVHPDSVDLTMRLVRYFDEPFGDSSAIPTFIVSEFARRHVTVALTGDGGDELFAGYDSLRVIEKMRFWDSVPRAFRAVLSVAANRLPYSAYGKNYLRAVSRPSALERYFETNYAPYFLRKQLLRSKWMLPADGAYLMHTFAGCLLPDGADVMTQAMYFEATSNLPGDMLVKVDRMSMANSLELRSPLLDHKLAELAATIPNGWKLRNGTGKYILLKALGDRLPPEILQRKKMGFAVPLGPWFRGPLREFIWDYLCSSPSLSRGVVSPEFVKRLLAEHDCGRRDNQHWLWSLLMMELWFRNLRETA